ncbi:cation transporter [Thermospira aquatica]|uniref:Cation-translocating P-type ATPase n=1 Tax=Thermospira aquatica TaxID=2828656 RepID=A0AAX3BFK7_9SPIR|nr:cation transporter [Thermospira aquatica]URA11143.1 cation-translocating P-type ATPase [Thermospira aquatica]
MEKKQIFHVSGMSCTSCALAVEKVIASIEGVKEVRVDFATRRALVVGENIPFERVKKVVQEIGYGIREDEYSQENLKRRIRQLLISWVGVGILLVTMLWHDNIWAFVVSLVVGFVTVILSGWDVFRAVGSAFRKRVFTMDVLIGVGVGASVITGVFHLLDHRFPDFVMVGVMILAIHLTGTYLKEKTTRRKPQGRQVRLLGGFLPSGQKRRIESGETVSRMLMYGS